MMDHESAVRELHDALGQALAQRDEAIRANQVLVAQLADLEHEHLLVCEALVSLRDSTSPTMAAGQAIHALVERVETLRQALADVMDAGSKEDATCTARNALDIDNEENIDEADPERFEAFFGEPMKTPEEEEVRLPTEDVEALSESVVEALFENSDRPSSVPEEVAITELDDPFEGSSDAPDMCGPVGDPMNPASPLCMRKPDHEGPHQTVGVVNIETDPSTPDVFDSAMAQLAAEGKDPAVLTAKALSNIKKLRKQQKPKLKSNP